MWCHGPSLALWRLHKFHTNTKCCVNTLWAVKKRVDSAAGHCKGKGSLCSTGKCLEALPVLSVDRVLRYFKGFVFQSKSTDLYLCLSQQECFASIVPQCQVPAAPLPLPYVTKFAAQESPETKLPLWSGNIKPIPHELHHHVWADCLRQTDLPPLKIQAICTDSKQVMLFQTSHCDSTA